MESTMLGTAREAFNKAEQSAQQNSRKSAVSMVKFVLLWLAVGLPLVWGVMKQWEEVRHLF